MDLVWLSPPSNNWNNLRIGFEGIKSGTVLMIGTLSIRDIESPHTVTETQRTMHWNIMSWDTSDSCLHLPGWNSSCSCYRRTITGDNIGWCWWCLDCGDQDQQQHWRRFMWSLITGAPVSSAVRDNKCNNTNIHQSRINFLFAYGSWSLIDGLYWMVAHVTLWSTVSRLETSFSGPKRDISIKGYDKVNRLINQHIFQNSLVRE